ncbi:MAG: exosome complex exonuclease Rrp41 [Candidatus Nanoarchaeia archaeon]|nr:exosome complex exonuclease Rrp41 [Candidatus Nanoarchaeia archaeon]
MTTTTYKKRSDGRRFDEPREMEAKVGVVPRADGSAMFKAGKSLAIAAVYGPRQMNPAFMRNPKKGTLRVNYNMMAFSGSGERVRPGPSRRSKEINLVIEKAFEPVIDTTEFSNTAIDLYIDLIQTDAGTRCAAINAATLALADAGINMKEMISAMAIGKVHDKICIDLTKEEEDMEAVDIPIAMTSNSGKVTLLQMDGVISREDLKEVLRQARDATLKVYEVQKKALMEKYGGKNE